MVQDPVCGMWIDPEKAFATREHAGQVFHLCSQECVDKFEEDPHFYGHPDSEEDETQDHETHHGH